MKELLDILEKKQVHVSVVDNDLKVKFNGPKLSDEILSELRGKKKLIVDYLKSLNVNEKFVHIGKARDNAHYPVSSAQRRLWTLSQIEEGNVAYNVTGVCTFEGTLNKEALELSFEAMIERHESLRTVFREDEEGNVVQVIQNPSDAKFKIICEDLMNIDQQEELVRRKVQEEIIKPFNLTEGPIIRTSLLKLQPNKWVFSYSMHHIVSDGWSMNIFIHELLQLYNAYAKKQKNPLEPLRVHYKDYAVWQQKQLRGQQFYEHKEYWLKHFEGDVPILEFPADYKRPTIKTYNGDVVTRRISKESAEKLNTLSQQQGGTLFMGILAVANLLLYRYTGQNDIVVGSPIAGREHSDLEGQIGFYVNTLALRTKFSGEMNFRELFTEVKRITFEAYDHQAYPFDELVEALQRQWDLARNQLFDVMVVLQNANMKGREPSSLNDLAILGYTEAKRVVSLFDLRFEFVESDDGLHLSLEFNTDIYNRSRIEQLARHFENMLNAAVKNPHIPIAYLDYLDSEERHQLLFGFNDNKVEFPQEKTFVDLLESQVAVHADRIAVVCGERQLTYLELHEQSNKLANFLRCKTEFQVEAKVAILQNRTPEFLISAIAILKAGGAYVPLDADLPEERLLYMIERADAQILLLEKSLIEMGNRLQWRSAPLKYLICVDNADVYALPDQQSLTDKDLWEHVGDTAVDAISRGGWMSSYTGEYFSVAEMKEYSLNAYLKLKDHLRGDTKVLEIGCASGLTLFEIAPLVKAYYGTDLSSSILAATSRTVKEKGLDNVLLSCMAAHEIDQLPENDFDLVIINSVIHSFNGYNYFRNVLLKVISKAKHRALIFLGDIMDEDKRQALIDDMERFKKNHQHQNYKTKTDWSVELFLAKDYLNDIIAEKIGIVSATYSDKIHSIPNELTRYRYDALLTIDKNDLASQSAGLKKTKNQFDTRHINVCSASSLGKIASKENLAYVIFTSGSTGKPKGAMIEHLGMLNHLNAKINALKMTEESRVIQNASQSFDISVWQFFAALLCGGKVIIYDNKIVLNPELFIKSLRRDEPTILEVVPSYLSVLLDVIEEEFKEEKLNSIKYLVVTGEELNPKLASRCFDMLPSRWLVNAYGPTEASDDITHHIFDHYDPVIRIPIGKVIQNLNIHILDDRMQICPIGVKGEICVSGIGVGRGYINDVLKSQDVFIDDPFRKGLRMYKTGDVGRFLADGTIEFFGRKDNQVKIRGHRIELGEIEAAILSHAEIKSVAVVTFDDNQGEKQLICYMVSDVSLDNLDIQTFLAIRLPSYMRPDQFISVDALPLTSNGKIDRKRLPIPHGEKGLEGSQRLGPRNNFEERLIKLWSTILNVGAESISIGDNFFELGGHSLKATRLVSQIHKEFNVRLPLKDLFRNGLFEEQAKLIQEARKTAFLNISTVSAAPSYPVSSSQRRLWMISQVEAGNVAYIMPGSCTFEGALNMEALHYAFDTLIARHESLRTVFKADENGEVSQVIKNIDETGFHIKELDIRGVYERDMHLKECVKAVLSEPFDLTKGPLIRVQLFRLAEDQWVFVFCMHHIISDGWSMNIFISELLSLYNASVKGQPNPLPPLKLQYKDYASWQQQQISGPLFEDHKAYWLQQFSGDLPVLELPTDRIRPTIKSYSGSIVTRTFSKHTTTEFRELLKRSNCTLFMGLVAAVNTLLHRYTAQEDIIIGSPIAGREHSDLEGQIGFYVNTIAIRTRLNGKDSFVDLLEKIKETTLGAYEHQMYPFDELVQALTLQIDVSRNPLFDVMVVLQNTGEKGHDISKELTDVNTGTYKDFQSTVSLFDFRFDFREIKEGLSVNIEFNTDIYDRWRVEQMASHLEKIIEVVSKHSTTTLGQVDYINDNERSKILGFNNTSFPFPENKTLVDLFESQAAKSPDEVAIIFEEKNLTYRELNERSNQLAQFLISKTGLRAEARVGILQSRGLDLMVSILGILKASGAYVPLDIDYPADRLLYMLNDSGIEVLLTEKKSIEFANALQWRCSSLRHLVCIDSNNVYAEQGGNENTLMHKELWNSVGDTAADAISRGGWMSSYTGEYLSEEEMTEYANNVYLKLKDHIRKDFKVLEIGCSSGLTMFRIAPHVGAYYGTDMSSSILAATQTEALAKGHKNITLSCITAHEIDQLADRDFDLIIINSVIHCFKGHNYLRDVLSKSIIKLKSTGLLFLGDLMDEDKRDRLMESMVKFRDNNLGKGYRTKIDWSKELFISRGFLDDLREDDLGIVTIDYSDKIHTIENELTLFRFDALIRIDKKTNRKRPLARNKYQYDFSTIAKEDGGSLNLAIPARNLAYVLYTSGSTGNPKGCMLEHRGIVNRLMWMWNHYQFTTSDVILQKTTFTFDVSVWELMMPVCWGATMVMCHKDDVGSPTRIAELIEKHKVTCLHFVPSMLNAFMATLFGRQDISTRLNSLRLVITSGEALSLQTIKQWYEKCEAPVHNLYGPTEASIDVTHFSTSKHDTVVPIGKPIWNTEIYVFDDSDRLLPVGVPGEICIGGYGVARGYINQEELTSQKFVDNPLYSGQRIYRTGDIGRWMLDGNIEFVGRKDDQVKIRGHRIELGEIEKAMQNHKDVDDAVVIAKLNKAGDRELVAYLIGAGVLNSSELRSYLSKSLPAYMLPSHFVQMDAFPLTSSGKVAKKKLPNPEGLGLNTGQKYVAPRNDMEKKMIMLWKEVLGKENISIKDDFFELGGDSFKAIRIASRYGKQIAIIDLYKNPTVEALAAHLTLKDSNQLLYPLTDACGSEKISIVIVPYAAGDPVVYQNLAAAFDKDSGIGLYCVGLPRTELSEDRIKRVLSNTVAELEKEIEQKIKAPVLIHSECIGAGLALQLSERLQRNEKVKLIGTSVAGILARLKLGKALKDDGKNLLLLRFFKKIGATLPENHEDKVTFSRNALFDGALSIEAFNDLVQRMRNNDLDKLKTPLYCVVGDRDPLTKSFRTKYKKWEAYAEKVELIVINDVGHYISRDRYQELAYVLDEIGKGQSQRVCESLTQAKKSSRLKILFKKLMIKLFL